jgi:serine/threonine protein kinase
VLPKSASKPSAVLLLPVVWSWSARAPLADARADIYSLGATLWFALAGLTPHAGSTIEQIRNHQTRDRLPIEQLTARKVPKPLVRLLRSMLALDPGMRPASAGELMQALQSCRRKLGRRAGFVYGLPTLLAIVLVALFMLRPHGRKPIPASPTNIAPPASASLPEKSIAVLPLENLSDEKENAFFAAGIHDELLSDLSKIEDLKVISRTSVMQYKSGLPRNIREIAQHGSGPCGGGQRCPSR